MNILFLSQDYPPNQIGGVGSYIYDISRILAKMGNRVFVITKALDSSLEYYDQGVHVFRTKFRNFHLLDRTNNPLKGFLERLSYSYAISKKIRQIVIRYKIDIIESCEARAEGFWYYLFKKRPPLVIKLHTPESIVFKLNLVPQTLDYKLIDKLEEWWIHRANKIVGLNRAIVDLVSRHFRMILKHVPIAPNPINIEEFKPSSVIQKKEIGVIYVGRLEFRKGVHLLIRTIPSVLKKIPGAKFIFIGNDCGMKSYLLDKITQFKIQDSVKFIDQMPRYKLIEYYQRNTICVVPSLWENHPYAVLEAMACGKPVIASNVSGISEIIKDNINGILVPPGSVSALSRVIKKLLSDEKLLERLGNNARKYIEEEYAPIKIAQKNIKIYEELLEKNIRILK